MENYENILINREEEELSLLVYFLLSALFNF